MSAAQFAHTEGYREGYAAAAVAIYDECASVVRAWLADGHDPADIPRMFAQRARLEQTSKQQGAAHERNRTGVAS